LIRCGGKLAATEDETARLDAKQRSLVDGAMFALQGWAPRNQIAALESFARENTLALHVLDPTFEDQPPTLLSNPRPIAGAEGAVTFFMTPGYRAWDPTWVMFFSFAVFFAMILADAGYGLVLGLILAAVWKRLGRTAASRQFRQLAVFMVLVTIGYGVLIGSFFGFSPPAGSWLDRIVIKSDGDSIMQDREAMMLVSATIGVFHLVLANVVVAWRWLGSGHALSSLGWAVALVGGWLLTLTMLPKPDVMSLLSGAFGGQPADWSDSLNGGGWWMLIVGLLLVFLFSSKRPVFSTRPQDLLARLIDGGLGLTGVTKAFGDSLSYLRLFALGLASAQLAMLFNQMASDASQVPGVGMLLGLLVFLLGHALNFVLAVVGGVVHGLRLNCIEFFSWSLTDEGQPFEAFEMRANK
jgi:V/A-type H+-transporting ATPase subunit I